MKKIKKRDRQKFYELIMEYKNSGLTYIDSICKVMELANLKYNEVVRLLDPTIREEVKKEALEKHLLKSKED